MFFPCEIFSNSFAVNRSCWVLIATHALLRKMLRPSASSSTQLVNSWMRTQSLVNLMMSTSTAWRSLQLILSWHHVWGSWHVISLISVQTTGCLDVRRYMSLSSILKLICIRFCVSACTVLPADLVKSREQNTHFKLERDISHAGSWQDTSLLQCNDLFMDWHLLFLCTNWVEFLVFTDSDMLLFLS